MQGADGFEFVQTEFLVERSEFARFIIPNVKLKRLATGFDWVEGPVWFGDANCLLFSDIPNNRMCRWSEELGVSVFRAPSNFSNGHTRDRQGRLVSCEHGARRVTRTEPDGSITVIADGFEGSRLNSPNDVVVKSDGAIWFTDPHYGIITDYEGHKAEEELPCSVYRFCPVSCKLLSVASDLACPNGLAFNPDESHLYVSDTGRLFETGTTLGIHRYAVTDKGTLARREMFYGVDKGVSDGIRVDSEGNVWTSAGDGVHCISPAGELLGKVFVPEVVSNLCFGGRGKNRLFITGCTSLYSVALNVRGAQWP